VAGVQKRLSSSVVNSGAWVTDPTTNIFQNTYTVTGSGYLQSSASPANVQLVGNPTYDPTISGIHQLVVVPEPAIVLLWLSSIATVYAARRRNARSARSQESARTRE